jgi:hypothetical protein
MKEINDKIKANQGVKMAVQRAKERAAAYKQKNANTA